MNTEKVPIAYLKPGDKFRLGGTLPLLTVQRINQAGKEIAVAVHEDPVPIYDDCRRHVERVQKEAGR